MRKNDTIFTASPKQKPFDRARSTTNREFRSFAEIERDQAAAAEKRARKAAKRKDLAQ